MSIYFELIDQQGHKESLACVDNDIALAYGIEPVKKQWASVESFSWYEVLGPRYATGKSYKEVEEIIKSLQFTKEIENFLLFANNYIAQRYTLKSGAYC